MPAYLKAIISVLVILVAGTVFYFDRQSNGGAVQWVVLGLAVFMILAIWLFPEAKHKPGPDRH